MKYFLNMDPIIQSLVAGCFTWLITAAGAAAVFFFKSVNRKILDGMLGFAAGVMIAASVWSLILPAIEMAEEAGSLPWLPPAIGFLAGGVFLKLVDRFLPHLHMGLPSSEAEGPKTQWKRSILLILAITLHNIPEGLAVGVAFGAAASGLSSASITGALALTLGIGIQNFPEGTAVSVPLRREGMSRKKSFFYGQLSAVVEPISAVIGAAAVFFIKALLPYALAFAAGAMIFVVAEDLIPESQMSGNTDIATSGVLGGFIIMMILDVTLG